jgi:Myb-like DNA-binding protein FlbD
MNHCERKRKEKFNKEEDELIIKCVESMKKDCGCVKWSKIAKHFPSRKSKQIRERYLNYLKPNVNRSPLSASEMKFLAELVRNNEHLVRIPWKKISASFPGRSDIFLKNQYDCAKRKIMNNTFESDIEKKKQEEIFQLFLDDDSLVEKIDEQLMIID